MRIYVFLMVLLTVCSCKNPDESPVYVKTSGNEIIFGNKEIEIKFDSTFRCRISYKKENGKVAWMNHTEETTLPTHFLITDSGKITDFTIDSKSVRAEKIQTEFGIGKKLSITGVNKENGIEKMLTIELYDLHPNSLIWQAAYRNRSDKPIQINESISNYFLVDGSLANSQKKLNDMWTFQGVVYQEGADYTFPLDTTIDRENFTGLHPITRLGGGIPLIDLWNSEMGIAIASVEKNPTILSFPTKVIQNGTEISIKQTVNQSLKKGDEYKSSRSAVIVHTLDFFEPLVAYSALMKSQGLFMKEPSPETYEPFWCGWGYGSDFTMQDIYNVIPKLKALNIKWIVIDDRWFDRYGDWNPRKEIFPEGEKQIKSFVDSLHKQGFLVKIWWAPTLVQPSAPPPNGQWPSAMPGPSKLIADHPEWLVVDEKGNYPRCPRNMYFLNGNLPEVQNYIKDITHKFIADWGFDGHKLDAYYIVPPSYDSATSNPNLAYEAVPKFIQTIYETSKSLKPNSVTEICNCGTAQDYYQSLYIDQPVVADPVSFSQVRHRVKVSKALFGPQCPVFTDLIERIPLTTEALPNDFASTIGTGGVPGTRFTFPNGREIFQLNPEKEAHWKKWLTIYHSMMLSKGDYTNLYDIGYDKPETHVIKKEGKIFYAFYDKDWNGEIELRGLENKRYLVKDYVNDKNLGQIKGPSARVKYSFKENLLIECTPVD